MRFLVVALLAVAAAAQAGDEARWRVDAEGGAFVPLAGTGPLTLKLYGNDVVTERFRFSTRAHFDRGAAYAVGLGYALTDFVEVGGTFHQGISTAVHNYGVDRGHLLVDHGELNVFALTAGLRVYGSRPDSRLRPWGLFQTGWYRADANVYEPPFFNAHACTGAPPLCEGQFRSHAAGVGFGVNVGGGLDVRISHEVSAGIDVRYHNAFTVLHGFDFLTTMVDVAFHF